MSLFGRDLFLFGNDLFLFGNDMFLFGNDMFIFFVAKLYVAVRRCYVSVRLLRRRLARRFMAISIFQVSNRNRFATPAKPGFVIKFSIVIASRPPPSQDLDRWLLERVGRG